MGTLLRSASISKALQPNSQQRKPCSSNNNEKIMDNSSNKLLIKILFPEMDFIKNVSFRCVQKQSFIAKHIKAG